MSNNIVKELIAKTMAELSAPPAPIQASRTWQHPQGYRFLVQWSNAVLLRYLIRLFTSHLPKSEYRRKAQVDDAARSVVRNIEEGYKRSNTATYLEFIGFSQGSLEEVKGDVRELTEDVFLPSIPGSSLASIGLNLKDLNTSLKPGVKGDLEDTKGDYGKFSVATNTTTTSFPLSSSNPPLKSSTNPGRKPGPDSDQIFLYRPLTVLYPPLAKVRPTDLTYEVYLELINKTDFLLRTLVQSLEKKLRDNQLGYKIDQARIKDAIKGR